MPDHSGLRGTDVGQDTRFKDKEAASIKATKFPANFSEKVDLRKVNLSVLKPWIAKKVIELIRVDDDIVVEFVFSMLEDRDMPTPDPKKLQVSLLGFMDKYGAAAFMEELWTLLLSAQSSVGGIPAAFLNAKKAEIQNRQSSDAPKQGSDMIRMGAVISPSGRPGAADMFDQRPRDNGRQGQGPGRDGDRRNDRDRDNGYGSRGPPQSGRYDDRPPPGRGGGDRGRDNGYGNRGPPRRSPSPRRDRDRDDRGPPRGSRDDRGPPRGDRDGYRGGRDDNQRRPTPPRRPSPPPRRRSPSPPARRRSPSPPPRRRARDSDTPPARKRGSTPTKEKAGISKRGNRDDTPPLRRARSPSRSPSRSPPRRRRRSPSRTPTPSDHRGRSRSPTVTPPRKQRETSTPPRKKRDDSTPPRKHRDDSTPPRKRRSPTRSKSLSPPPRKRRYDSSPSPPPKERKERSEGRSKAKEGGGSQKVEGEAKKPKKKLDGALGKSRWADDE